MTRKSPSSGNGAAEQSRSPHQPGYAEVAATWPQLIRAFLTLGVVAFGGPVAHIAMMDKEIVERRKWVSRRHFLDLIGATNLLPGPNSTQMTMHIGYVQRGDLGIWIAGMAFILPAALITYGLTWLYVTYRDLPAVDAAFYGIQPVVLAIIVVALVKLAPSAADDLKTRLVFIVALGLGLFGINELVVLALGAIAGAALYANWRKPGAPAATLVSTVPWLMAAAPQASVDHVGQLAWLFFKFGITLFGSGYLLVAYLQRDLVERHGLLTTEQLIEAIVIGEMTPGPLFTVSTAIGTMLGGVQGAVVATTAIFVPSFFLAMLLGRIMPAVKRSTIASHVLKGLTAAVLGVMLAVAITIGNRVVIDIPTAVIAAAGLAALIWTRVSAIALVPIGALAGWLWVTVGA
ncbi:MAG: chromate efflux transporter [Nitriliruptoraceae bacterium]